MYNPDRDTEYQPTNPFPTLTERIRGIHNDSSGKIWSIYLAEADKQDEDITTFWRGEADSILVFTGLFSGIISAFLSLSLPLINLQSGQPSASGFMYTSAYVACVLWLFSLVLSLTAALYATLFQQWSRRYLELTQRRVAPHRRARIRGYMFGGISKFKMSLAVKIMPVLLHLSIFFFIAGLVVFVMGIGLIAGGCVLAFASVFAFGYIALTVLPYLYLNSPYSTPFSEFPWRKFQRLLLAAFSLIRGLSLSIRHLLSGWRPINQHTEELSRWSWEEAVEMRIKTHQKWLKHGLQKSIMDGATDAASNMDKVALSWTLTVLDDDREFEDFVARVPGFFDSDSISHAPSVILPLMDVQSPQSDQLDPILGSRINDLLQTCIPGTSLLTEPLRINRLRV